MWCTCMIFNQCESILYWTVSRITNKQLGCMHFLHALVLYLLQQFSLPFFFFPLKPSLHAAFANFILTSLFLFFNFFHLLSLLLSLLLFFCFCSFLSQWSILKLYYWSTLKLLFVLDIFGIRYKLSAWQQTWRKKGWRALRTWSTSYWKVNKISSHFLTYQ